MKKFLFSTRTVVLVLTVTTISACSSSINKTDLQANSESPESARVAEVAIPFDPDSPRFVLAVEPFILRNGSIVETDINGYNRCDGSECDVKTSVKNLGQDVTSQLITALTKVGNIAVLDHSMMKKRPNGGYSAQVGANERGPFLVKGTLTELSEVVESNKEKRGASFGWVGLVSTIAGAVSGKPGLTYAGAGVLAANPQIDTATTEKKGTVVFDVQILDAESMRIVASHRAQGTFTAASASNGISIFGISKDNEEFAESALGQAMRVAMNDAVSKIWNSLQGNRA